MNLTRIRNENSTRASVTDNITKQILNDVSQNVAKHFLNAETKQLASERNKIFIKKEIMRINPFIVQ